MNTEALKDLLYRLADDDLIIGHRHSEWTGLGPILEEDIAFSSMAQDEVGHALSYYSLLHTLGEDVPDNIAFTRNSSEFRSCQLTEQPNGDYAFSLIRHLLYDTAKYVRLQALVHASWQPLAELAERIMKEHKYHLMHAKTWAIQLGNGTEESRLRLQSALNEAYPMAFGIFETTEYSDMLAEEGICPTENDLVARWLDVLHPILDQAKLHIPANPDFSVYMGGRKGYHSEHLQPLLNEMTVVFRTDPQAVW
jgi:ring-1,2-phenylacetyl-CoA epoxidase subunit PaaC